jgi:LysR family transcriptional regulator, transcriptional activator of the cysJI operon
MLNLEWFRTFKVIYEVGTLTAAAEALYISQPGVSLHLNSLEAYTGYRLFERDNRRCIPTERATILYNFIIEPIIRLEGIEQQFHRKSRTSKPTLSIGMCYMTFQLALEQQVGRLPFNLIARFGECSPLIADLNNGHIDFVLTSQNTPMPNIEYSPFQNQRIMLVCGKETDTSRLDELKSLTDRDGIRDWLRQQTWFATAVDMEYLKKFWLINFNAAPDFRPSYVLPNFSSILASLKTSSGFAVMPDFLCKTAAADGQVKLPWLDSTCPEQQLYFGKRKKTGYANEIQQLEEMVTANWGS